MDALDVVGLGEVALRLGITPKRAYAVTRRPGFPAPCTVLINGRRIWRGPDVEAWCAEHWPRP